MGRAVSEHVGIFHIIFLRRREVLNAGIGACGPNWWYDFCGFSAVWLGWWDAGVASDVVPGPVQNLYRLYTVC